MCTYIPFNSNFEISRMFVIPNFDDFYKFGSRLVAILYFKVRTYVIPQKITSWAALFDGRRKLPGSAIWYNTVTIHDMSHGDTLHYKARCSM